MYRIMIVEDDEGIAREMFNLRNLKLVIAANIAAFLVFCLFYVVIYKFTAGAYYAIVSDDEKK